MQIIQFCLYREQKLSAFVSPAKEASGWIIERCINLQVELFAFEILALSEFLILTLLDCRCWDFQIANMLDIEEIELVAWVFLRFLLLENDVDISLVKWLVKLIQLCPLSYLLP